MKVLILAGGFATRLWPLTETLAKPLVPLADQPLIAHIIDKIPQQTPIYISTNAVFASDFETMKKEHYPQRNIEIFVEDSQGETEKKGALGATSLFISHHLQDHDDDLMLLAGDNYFGFDFDHFIQYFQEKNTSPLLAAYDIKDKKEAQKFGVIVPSSDTKSDQTVQAFEEKPENPSSTLVSTGAYIFPKNLLSHIKTYAQEKSDDLGGIFEYFLQKNMEVRYFSFAEKWYDIGSFTAFLDANIEFLDGKTHRHPSSILHEVSTIGSNMIEKNVTLKNVFLENTIIREGSHITNASLRNCVIGKNVTLKDIDLEHKIIRDGTFFTAQ